VADDAVLAIVLEPTDGQVELGCLGGLHALVTFPAGRPTPHGPGTAATRSRWPANSSPSSIDDHVRDVEVDGIAYRDVWSATQAWSDGFGPDSDPDAARSATSSRQPSPST
jgi:succinyl-diaminopimelate desuccinylase